MNEIGYAKLSEIQKAEGGDFKRKSAKVEQSKEFCSVEDSEILPEVCNEFILRYCPARGKRASLPKR